MTMFKKIIILGLGLIGGSMALALKKSGYEGTIIGFDISKEHLSSAVESHSIDIGVETLEEALEHEGLIIAAVPLGACKRLFQEIAVLISPQKTVVITDVGSVKTYVHKLAARYLPATALFIGGHPMSGSEQGGFHAATATLFENAYYFLTPTQTHGEALAGVQEIVRRMGAFPVIVSPAEHDRIVAQISHVPHIMASVLSNTLDAGNSVGNATFAGGGFRDTTRIASGDPCLWKDIISYNREEILHSLVNIETMMNEVKQIITSVNDQRLFEFLSRAKFIRDCLPQRGKDYLPALYNIIIDVEDKPGIIGQLTQIVGENHLNIREIEVLHVRENSKGAIRIGFATEEEQLCAVNVLATRKFKIHCV